MPSFPFLCPLFLFLLLSSLPSHFAVNITALLSPHPSLSAFSRLLSATSIPDDLTQRSSLTLLAVPNRLLDLSHIPTSSLPDALRYHILLQFLSWPDLRRLPPNGALFTTLFQTTGRAPSSNGDVNVTVSPDGAVILRSPFSNSSTTILSQVISLPYNISIFTVNSFLVPYDLSSLSASENLPPAGPNIIQALINGQNFNVAAALISSSGVLQELEADESGAGITVFAPTDQAFAEIPKRWNLQSLPADKKVMVLRFHVLHSYYTLGSLESIVNPVQPTLATEDSEAEQFRLSITRVHGSVAIDTGIVQAAITQTVFYQNPVAIFGISQVLLPKEIFDEGAVRRSVVPPPETGLVLENSDDGAVIPPALSPDSTGFTNSLYMSLKI